MSFNCLFNRPVWSVAMESYCTWRCYVKAVLRKSFGDVGQQDCFRAELHSRRRKSGEWIHAVYTDVHRLLELSYPGETGSLLDSVGRNAFLSALGDPSLRIRIMDHSPTSMDEACTMVMRMDAYSTAVLLEETVCDEPKKTEGSLCSRCGWWL